MSWLFLFCSIVLVADCRRYQKAVPTGQFAEPEEVASIVTFLCQDSSKNITGQDVRIDGGYTAR